jgi:hypothetical protein
MIAISPIDIVGTGTVTVEPFPLLVVGVRTDTV